jgi:hypothetical protein
MSDIRAEIRDASHKNTELLRLLAETSYASSFLTQQKIVSDLENQLARSDKKLHDLDQERLANLQTHKKYRDSHFRKFLITASGKKEWFAGMADKEEQDYFETLQQAQQAQEHNSSLKAQLAEAQNTLRSVESLVQRHRGVQRQLDELEGAGKQRRAGSLLYDKGETRGTRQGSRTTGAGSADDDGDPSAHGQSTHRSQDVQHSHGTPGSTPSER